MNFKRDLLNNNNNNKTPLNNLWNTYIKVHKREIRPGRNTRTAFAEFK
jgi:hypothetical protein